MLRLQIQMNMTCMENLLNKMSVKSKSVFLLFFFCVWYIEDDRSDLMATEITSKSELIALAAKLDSKSKEMVGTMDNISTVLKSVSSYDGIDVSSAANILSGNLTNLSTDFTNISLNISNYAKLIDEFDSDDFDTGLIYTTNDANSTINGSINSNYLASSNNSYNSYVFRSYCGSY